MPSTQQTGTTGEMEQLVAAGAAGWSRGGAPARWRRTLLVACLRLLLIVIVLALWQYLASTGHIRVFFTGSPEAIWKILRGWIVNRTIFEHIQVTLTEAGLGFILALFTGIPLGFVFARLTLVDEVLQPFVDVLNATPRIALVSLMVLWLGLGTASKVALVYSVVIFPFIINTYAGIKSVEEDYIRIARLLGASRLQVDMKVVLPWCVPVIFAGVRLAVAYAFAAAVVAEIVASNKGLGFLVAQNTSLLNTAGAMAAIAVLMVVAWVVNRIPEVLERYLLRWRAGVGM